MSIAQKKDNEHSLHYLFPVFMRFLCLFCMMFHMFEGEYIQELFCSLCLRMFEKFIGSGLLHDLTLVDENNFVRYRLCKLHLMGYDHMTPEDAAEMERLQEEILQQLGISRQ